MNGAICLMLARGGSFVLGRSKLKRAPLRRLGSQRRVSLGSGGLVVGYRLQSRTQSPRGGHGPAVGGQWKFQFPGQRVRRSL